MDRKDVERRAEERAQDAKEFKVEQDRVALADAKAENPENVQARVDNAVAATRDGASDAQRKAEWQRTEDARKKAEAEVAADQLAVEVSRGVPDYDNRVPGVFRPRPNSEQAVAASEKYAVEAESERKARELRTKAEQLVTDQSGKVDAARFPGESRLEAATRLIEDGEV